MKNSINGSQPYGLLWKKLRSFPSFVHKGASSPPTSSGGAAAFFISGGIGSMTMMIVHHFADTSASFEKKVTVLGSWIPGAVSLDPMWGNIGSYAGKETALILGWLISLAILYPILKNRQIKSMTIFGWLFGLYTLAAVMAWHPAFPYLPLQ